MKHFGIILFIICLFPVLAIAGENEWTYVGLYPERMTDIVVHPNDPDILYASALDYWFTPILEGGIFKTTDHGLTWDTLGFRDYIVKDLVFDPQHPETLWAGCGVLTGGDPELGGTFRSTDGGETWERRSEGLFLGGADGFGVTSIDISPFNSNLLMCTGADPAGRGWLARTTNGGGLWTEVGVYDDALFKVVFDSLWPGRVFANSDFELWISEDSGATFRYINIGLADFVLDPFRMNWLWLMEHFRFLYSPDAGFTLFEPDTSFPPEGHAGGFVRVVPERINTVYVTTLGRVFQTEDGGLSRLELTEGWPTGFTSINAISVVASSPTELWAGLGYFGILSYTVVDTSNVVESSGPDAQEISLSIYPNPASNILYLNIPSWPYSGTFSLYNVLGQRVFSVSLSQSNGVQAITLPHTLPSGAYFGSFIPRVQQANIPVKTYPVVIVK